jgi:N-acetylglucosaminyl-diphospho-decaprenol L-rhamnosyltransferase
MSDLSIITVTYQSAGKIMSFVDAARTAAPSADIVVVDNASSDETRQLVNSAPGVKLVQSSHNIGFGRGCNLGVNETQSTWLLFVNPDVMLKEVTVPRDVGSGPFGLGGGMIESGDVDGMTPGVRAELTLPEEWMQEIWQLFIPRGISRYMYPRRWPVGWPVGGICMARRDEYQRVGGFDPRYFLFFEDRDLGFRYRRQRMPVRLLDGLAGKHWMGSSSDVETWRREAWSIISWIEYIAVWRGTAQAARTASRVVATLNTLSKVAGRPALPSRVHKKAHQARSMVEFITNFDNHLPHEPYTYYPGARVALSKIRSESVP